MQTTELDRAADTWSVGAIIELASLRAENVRQRDQIVKMESAIGKILADADPEKYELYQGFIDAAGIYQPNADISDLGTQNNPTH